MVLGRKALVAGGALMVLASVAVLIWRVYGGGPTRADPADPELAALGKAVYAQHCAACHGGNLEGQPHWRERLPNGRLPAPPHDSSGHAWHHPDKQLFEITKNGLGSIVPGYESDMPAFKGTLSDHEVWAVLSFIESTWSPEIRQRQDRMSQRVY